MSQTPPTKLITGHGTTRGLVACVPEKKDSEFLIHRYLRNGNAVEQDTVPFRPLLWVAQPELADHPEADITELTGNGLLKYLVEMPTLQSWQDLVKAIKKETGINPSARHAPYCVINDMVQQYLMRTGETLFNDLRFDELHRLQVDIETYTTPGYDFPNAEREDDRIIAIALADQTGWTEVLSATEHTEKELLEQFVQTVIERDPDVIEGHNLFKFDLPFIKSRAKRHKVKLKLGRDGSTPRTTSGRFSAGERVLTYPKMEIIGRHVVDTLFMVQAYDVATRELEGFGLKTVARHFGVAAENRTYVEGSEISRIFDEEPDRLMDYARDDIIETRAVSDLLSPVYFTQAQLLPYSYQNVCVRGTGAKIDALMIREYLRQETALPYPDEPYSFEGGYTDMFETGVVENIRHCDVRSLYPSLMLKDDIKPASDELGIFLELLEYLRTYRLEAKQKARDPDEPQAAYWEALQNAYKILINSFYGYLGFSQGRFNDFPAAEKVAAEGRALLRRMIDWLREHDSRPVEIDTDGIYFVPPEDQAAGEAWQSYQEAFQNSLPPGIEVEFDASYAAMFSYKMKNYALLDESGKLSIKGAALKSRGLEPFQRQYMQDMLRCLLERREGALPALQQKYRASVQERKWPVTMLAKTETLQESPASYAEKIKKSKRARNAAYELALASERKYEAGDQVSYYVTGDKKSVTVYASAKLVSDWDPENRDENVPYYLGKLESLFKKFNNVTAQAQQGELL